MPPPKCEPWELVLKAKNPVLLLPLVPLPELKTGGRLAPGYKAKLESSSVLLEPSWPQKEITAQKKKNTFPVYSAAMRVLLLGMWPWAGPLTCIRRTFQVQLLPPLPPGLWPPGSSSREKFAACVIAVTHSVGGPEVEHRLCGSSKSDVFASATNYQAPATCL